MTRDFNPGEHKGGDGKGGGGYLKVAGDFLLIIRRFSRDKNKNKKEYLDCQYVVIDGEHKGEKFNDRIYTTDESLWKLGSLCTAMQFDQRWDVDNHKETREAICNRPFKAKVKVKSGDKQDFPEIDMYLYKTTDAENDAMDRWSAEHEANQSVGGGGDDRPPPHGDDDIPF